jgi:hypothetical protein
LINERLQQMLSEFRRALYDAISDSSDVHRTWRQLRDEGYALFLLVDCKKADAVESAERGKLALAPDIPELPPAEPVFQMNGQDLSFLKSLGIDPTRRRRR